jgi:hypothetical protein
MCEQIIIVRTEEGQVVATNIEQALEVLVLNGYTIEEYNTKE